MAYKRRAEQTKPIGATSEKEYLSFLMMVKEKLERLKATMEMEC